MPIKKARDSRKVSVGVKIYFDDNTFLSEIVFANEPTMLADIPAGTSIVMSTPITLVGGKQEINGPSAVAEFTGTALKFLDKVIPLNSIRGGNWGRIEALPV